MVQQGQVSAWRLRERTGCAGGTRTRAREIAASTRKRADAHARRAGRAVPRPARSVADRRWRSCAGYSPRGRSLRERRLDELQPHEIAAWRMTIRPGYRFEATQALRQVLQRAVVWGMLDVNPAKHGRREPAATRDREATVRVLGRARGGSGKTRAAALGPMVIFAAATGLRPGEWVALEERDIDRDDARRLRPALVRQGQAQVHEDRSKRACRAAAGDRDSPRSNRCPHRPGDLLFPAPHGGYLDLHNFRNRDWKPAQLAAGIEPFRRIYDLRHTFATFALRAGISTFDLSRYMGASLTMIDRHCGRLARDGREHAIRLLDSYGADAVDHVPVSYPRAVAGLHNRQRLRREVATAAGTRAMGVWVGKVCKRR